MVNFVSGIALFVCPPLGLVLLVWRLMARRSHGEATERRRGPRSAILVAAHPHRRSPGGPVDMRQWTQPEAYL